jgi:histidinol-phosphate aminotransferase
MKMPDTWEQSMISRRGFMGTMSALAATPLLSEVALAQAARVNSSASSQPVWLDSNENPAGPPRAAIEALIRSAPDAWRYGFEQQLDLTAAIAAREKLSAPQVTAGVGSGDVIAAAICAFTSVSLPMITASPSYDIVVSFARRLGRNVVEIPLTKEWAYPVRELAAAAQKSGGGFIYLCNPNNPTSSLTSPEDIEWLATHLPANTVLFVDEAYLEFVDPTRIDSAVRHVRAGLPVIVSRTYSKIFGMAGLRMGYGCASAENIAAINGFLTNCVPLPTVHAVNAVLAEGPALITDRRRNNQQVRGELCAWLRERDVKFIEPHANFIMIDVRRDVASFGKEMLGRGISVGRPFPPLDHYLRVTIGTADNMRRFMQEFASVYRA